MVSRESTVRAFKFVEMIIGPARLVPNGDVQIKDSVRDSTERRKDRAGLAHSVEDSSRLGHPARRKVNYYRSRTARPFVVADSIEEVVMSKSVQWALALVIARRRQFRWPTPAFKTKTPGSGPHGLTADRDGNI